MHALVRRLEEYRNQERSLTWKGSFADYLQIVRYNPKAARLAHARVYDMIMSHGVREENGVRHYNFFEQGLYGLQAYLQHSYEGTELDSGYLRHTLIHLQHIWQRPVHLATVENDQPVVYTCSGPREVGRKAG